MMTMKMNFKISGLAIMLCLLTNVLCAQEILTGFNHRSDKVTSTKSSTEKVCTLPFFDDFSTNEMQPDSMLWNSPNILINAGFPVNSPTRNVATFDVLDANGAVYSYAISNPFISEYLRSVRIRLDSIFMPEAQALTPADSLYLSFYYQPQGNGNMPEENDSLVLEFGIPNEFDTTWYHIWSAPGQSLESFREENDGKDFKQVMIPITDQRFFTDSFFFRFYNYASIVNSSQPSSRGNEDNWNLDLVYLDWHRSIEDSSIPKISFTNQHPSFLNRYRCMPYRQYKANPTTSVSEELNIYVSNLDKVQHQLAHQYSVQQVNGNQSYTYKTTHPFTLEANTIAQHETPFVYSLFSLDYDRDTASYLVKHYISDSTCNPPLVDSLIYHQGFYNYFAYDDGIPELGYGVEPAFGSFAVKFELTEFDTIRGVQILFNHTLNDANNKYFDLVVWKDNNGHPGDEIYRLPNQKPIWEDQVYQFSYYKFDKLVKLSGIFYVGLIQQSTGVINIGFDTSFDNSDYNYYNVTGSWQHSSMPGSIMIRPVLGPNYYIGIEEDPAEATSLAIYPNPASSMLHLDGISDGQSVIIYDMTGRRINTQPFNHVISLEGLHNGIYLLQVTTLNGTTYNKKFMVAQ